MSGKWSISFLHCCTLWTRASLKKSRILRIRENWEVLSLQETCQKEGNEILSNLVFEVGNAMMYYSREARWWPWVHEGIFLKFDHCMRPLMIFRGLQKSCYPNKGCFLDSWFLV